MKSVVTSVDSVIKSLAREGYTDAEIVRHFKDKLLIAIAQRFVRNTRKKLAQ